MLFAFLDVPFKLISNDGHRAATGATTTAASLSGGFAHYFHRGVHSAALEQQQYDHPHMCCILLQAGGFRCHDLVAGPATTFVILGHKGLE